MAVLTISNTAKLSVYALLGSLILPFGLFVFLTTIGFDADEISIVGFVFWVMLFISIISALHALYYQAKSRATTVVLIVAVTLGVAPVLGKLRAYNYSSTVHPKPFEPREKVESDKHSDPKCKISIVGDHKPFVLSRPGTDGVIGWHFAIANLNSWTLKIEIARNNNEINATALALGSYSPWYRMFSGPTFFETRSSATGIVACRWNETQSTCTPIVNSDESPQSNKYWASLATVKEKGREGASTTVTAQAIAAIGTKWAMGQVVRGTKGIVVARTRHPNAITRIVDEDRSFSFICAPK